MLYVQCFPCAAGVAGEMADKHKRGLAKNSSFASLKRGSYRGKEDDEPRWPAIMTQRNFPFPFHLKRYRHS
jgi:hypothetical protein